MSTAMESVDSAVNEDKSSNPLRSAWRKSYPGLAAIAFFSIFINILKLAAPIYILQILDKVVASGSLETLVMLTIITLVAIVTGVSLEVVRRRMFMHWGSWIELTFGPKLFSQGLKQENRQGNSTSSNLRNLATIRSFIAGQGLSAWMDLIWAPAFILIVYLISPPLSYIVLVGSVIALLLGVINEVITRDARNATLKAGNADRQWVDSAQREQETIGSLKMIRNLTHLWSDSVSSRLDESMRSRAVNVYFTAGIRMVGRLVRIGVLGVGIWLVVEQTLTIGSVIAAHVLGRTAYSLVQGAMIRWREMVKAKRAYGNIKKSLVISKEPRLSRPQFLKSDKLVMDNVAYRYPQQSKSVLRRIDLTLNPGEVLCVIGESASGKSTFSRLASGMIAPRSGNIRLGEVDVQRLQKNSLQNEIGYLPEKIALFQGTVRENIASMAAGNMQHVVQAATLAGIHNTILTLPEGYDTEISDEEPLLSAGQRKSIAVARAFYGTPPLIVMDEPLPHLDTRTQMSIMSSLVHLKDKGTVSILTTQRNSLARFADKVLLLHENTCILLDKRDEIEQLSMQTGGSFRDNVEAIRKRNKRRNRKNLRSV